MFDTVMVPCPTCGTKSEFQSKSGACILAVYELNQCPFEVLSGVTRHAPNTCEKCGTVFEVQVQATGTPVPVTPTNEDDD
jgi:predicted RNA-binding Zn-ribbon protein involved in translation (DUF1610 family)